MSVNQKPDHNALKQIFNIIMSYVNRAATKILARVILTGFFFMRLSCASYAQSEPVEIADNSQSEFDLYSQNQVEEGGIQVTGIDQLSDVSPGDWPFEALVFLVERYDCLHGYTDSTFQGSRAVNRYEFAAALNACLEKINSTPDLFITGQDLETVEQLQRVFRAELIALSSRVNSLESQTQQLESQQFSTTTKLFGQVIIGVQGRTDNQADFFPVDGQQDLDDPGTSINLITNTQLSLATQFSPRSFLLIGLQAGTGSTAPRLTNDVRLGYEADTDGEMQISDLTYRHLLGDRLALVIGTEGVSPVNVFRGANRIESSGFGPLSAFAQRNPIINIGSGRGGLGFDWQVSRKIALQGVYSTTFPGETGFGGLFGGDAGGIVLGTQLNVAPTDSFDIALNYLYAYTPKESFAGNLGTGVGDDQVTVGSSLNTSAIGGTLSWRVSPTFVLGGWVGHTTSSIPDRSGNVETLNWMGFVNFPDLFEEGNLGGIYVGQPPRITSSDLPTGRNIPDLLAGGLGEPGSQPGTTMHVEAFYRHRISDQITLTPGVIVIFNPANTSGSDTIVIGAIRTTFSF